MMKAATQEEANAVTLVFWDIKKFPVPHGFDARRVRPCIKRWLENHGYHGPLTINAVGILTDVHRDILGALSSSGINLYYAPYGPSDIMDLILESTFTKPSPANLLGICDPIFLHKPESGFNIFGPFSSSSSSPYEISWINSILEVSEALDEDTCSETDESGGWCCLVCSEHIRNIRSGGFESFTSHLSSRDHERRKFRFLPVEDYQTMDLFEDVNPPTIVRKQPEVATPVEAFAETAVFWDMNMFPIPSYFDASRVHQCIKRFLEKYGYKGPLTIHAFGILTNFAPDTLEALSSSGIILIRAAHGSTAIKREMSDWNYAYPSPVVNLMGICDPRGFPLPLTGYNIFRPFPYSSPQLDGQLWKNTLLAGSGEEDMCSEAAGSARWTMHAYSGEDATKETEDLKKKKKKKNKKKY